jgi:molecular chaperone GrpE
VTRDTRVCYLERMSNGAEDWLPAGKPTPEVKVVDRRWWARAEKADETEAAAGKPTYVEELESRLAEKDRMLQDYIQQYKAAATEFDESRARARRDIAKEVERGKRAILVDLLEVVDNLDRAIESAREAGSVDVLLDGVKMVRQQFLHRLEGFGIHPIEPLNQPFDPALHEAITVVPASRAEDDEKVLGVIRRGYRIGDEVLRPAQVAVGSRT